MDKVICKAGQFEIKKMKVSKMGSQSEKNPGECIKNHVQFIKILVKTRPQKTVIVMTQPTCPKTKIKCSHFTEFFGLFLS